MRRPILWFILILLTMGLLTTCIYPPREKLRLGKDLRGGVALTYSVEIPASGAAGTEMMTRLIEVLKARVDPANQLDISFVPQGRDRLEITMPLPNERVVELRERFEAALEALASDLTPDRIELILRSGASERESQIARIGEEDPVLADRVRTLAGTYDEWQMALAAYREAGRRVEELSAAGASQEEIEAARAAERELAIPVADLENEYERLREEVLGSLFDPIELREALEKSNERVRVLDRTNNVWRELPSEREQAIARIKERHPTRVEQIDAAIAAFEEYRANRRTLDDPADLKRLLRGAGILDFRITVDPGEHPQEARLRQELQEKGPENVESTDTGWYRIQRVQSWVETVEDLEAIEEFPAGFFQSRGHVVEAYDGAYYMLCWDTPQTRLTREEGEWQVSQARPGVDQLGRPAINFMMDPRGSALLGQLSGSHIGQRMAILLDDQVITAPVLRGRISTSGIIEGDFSQAEINYIVRTLNAGSLQSRLSPEPIAENTIGPSLGLDNLRQGSRAGILSLVLVSAFMLVYYFPTCGGVAVFSLLCNAILIMAWMGGNGWAFTLPGIAGIVLTFGMAVDANVLIYERMREELYAGQDLRNAIRLGYSKAMSSIVDGNVTNLIVCVVLGLVGTQEIKGFAMTLGTGVVATLIAALIISRVMFAVLVDRIEIRRVSMLPMAVPLIERVLSPRINWLRLRWLFIWVSLAAMATGVAMVALRGEKMLDIEFKAGTRIVMETKEGVVLTRPEVERRVHAIPSQPGSPEVITLLRTANVDVINPEEDGITSNRFQVDAEVSDQQAMAAALAREFATELEVRQPVSAAGITPEADGEQQSRYRFPIRNSNLGRNIDNPAIDGARYQNDVREWIGGGVIILKDITPPVSRADLLSRLERMREQPDFSGIAGHKWDLIVLEGTPESVTTAAYLFLDEANRFTVDPQSWSVNVANPEWDLVADALQTPPTFASVVSFSPAIAEAFRNKAIVAVLLSFVLITIYIWVRFGSMRYSLAALACLVHDVLTVLGLVALAEVLWDMEGARRIVEALGVKPFKINLDMIAALLTIIGYSLNDTIIVMDRIRENRGRLPFASDPIINRSINETISRTVITSGTTLLAVVVLYMFGGLGVRGFAYALLVGIVIGTYSSIAVAAQLVRRRIMAAVADEKPGNEGPSPAPAGEGVREPT